MNPDDGAVTATSPEFKLRLLGFPAITSADGGPLVGLGPGKPLALLAYLAVRHEARREELVDLLWGEVSEANARNAFRQALHRLRTALGESVIPMERERVQLAPDHRIDVDRTSFLNAIDRGDFAGAVQLYRGDFLDGFDLGEPVFDSWVDAERVRLKGRFQAALQTAAESALGAGRWVEALQYVQRLTAVAPFDENAALLEANVLIAAGRPTEALVGLRRFIQVAREQLDMAPSPRVREMLARIERSESARDSTATSAPAQSKETPFIAREGELGRLLTAARSLTAERGATVFVEGPAGIGKSRLVSEFLTRARGLGPMLVLRGRERPLGTTLPYASVAEALRGAVRAPGVAGTGRHLLAEAARILPELRDNFELPEPTPIDAEGGRLRFFEGIAAFLDSAAYEQPVCLVLDDMHHASPSTVDLVGYLSGRLQSSPVLIVLIYREDAPVNGALDRLRQMRDPTDGGPVDTLEVGALSSDAIAQLMDAVAARHGAQGQIDVEALALAADGNPLRAIDLARRALNGELPDAIPARLRDILSARLQRATPSERRVFFAAALLQRRCSLRLLSAAAHLPEPATFEAARGLETAGLLAQESDGYVLAHDFTSAFVVEISGLAGRALLAGWAADALAHEPSPPSAELANLYALAGQQTVAFEHARRAVYDAAALGSSPEVQRLLGLALAVAPDAIARDQVEGMMAAFGSGKKLLPDPSPQARVRTEDHSPTAERVPSERPASAMPSSAKPASVAVPAARRLLTPRLAALIVLGAVTTIAAVSWTRSLAREEGPNVVRDSLLVVERGREGNGAALVVTGPIETASTSILSRVDNELLPQWAGRLALPWIRPRLAPGRNVIAIERMTSAGTDVYVMSGDTANPVAIAVGGGVDAALGWSPDGERLLVRRGRTLSNGAFDADLWAYRIGARGVVDSVAIDTSTVRSVEEEAAWSPDGTRIAWVAQIHPANQRDVFLSRADGSGLANLTENAAEDFRIAWSADGNLLAFTSDRGQGTDLFAIELDRATRRLWRLTNTADEEDFASFSPDGRFVAFQSTRAGDAAVYLMPALGGTAVRVTPAGGQYSIAGWRGRPSVSYIDRFRIIGSSTAGVGDSIPLSLFIVDRDGNARMPDSIAVDVAGAPVTALRPRAAGDTASAASHRYVLAASRSGIVKVIASIPGWRSDTLTIQVGAASGTDVSLEQTMSAERWLSLGDPAPSMRRAPDGKPGLYPNGDLQWQSGILSRETLSLGDTVDVTVTFVAPFSDRPTAGALLSLALVAEPGGGSLEPSAPRLTEHVSVVWDGEGGRFTYSVGRESKSDPISTLGRSSAHVVRVVNDTKGLVSFFVDGRLRWTSSLRFLGTTDWSARLWLGGRATSSAAYFTDLSVHRRR